MENSPVLSWKVAGLLLGLLVITATALVTPFGVSTQYVVTDAVVYIALRQVLQNPMNI